MQVLRISRSKNTAYMIPYDSDEAFGLKGPPDRSIILQEKSKKCKSSIIVEHAFQVSPGWASAAPTPATYGKEKARATIAL